MLKRSRALSFLSLAIISMVAISMLTDPLDNVLAIGLFFSLFLVAVFMAIITLQSVSRPREHDATVYRRAVYGATISTLALLLQSSDWYSAGELILLAAVAAGGYFYQSRRFRATESARTL